MDSLKISEDVCRICLKQKIKLNWNGSMLGFCGLSYKDCYYKYTQLEELDSDCYPTSLCEICANELESAHVFFEKALESFNFLQDLLRTKELELKYRVHPRDEVDETMIEVKDQTLLSPVCDGEITANTENELSESEQMAVGDNVTIEPIHIDIQHVESLAETLLEQHLSDISNAELEHQLNESFDTKLVKSSSIKNKKATEKRRKCHSLNNTSFKQQLTHNSSAKKADNKMKNIESLNGISLNHNFSENCETKSALPATKLKQSREKYLCAYCSLNVQGAGNLAIHEATHNENRKRTEICPKCGVKLYTKYALTLHMKIHDENRQKNYKCEFCGNGFYTRGSLNVHRRKHLGLMVKCQLCNKEYCRQVDLDEHLLKHSACPLQKNVEKKKYTIQCQYCNKSVLTFKWKTHLAAHLDQPQVKCKICDRNFFSRKNCTNHLRRLHCKDSSEYDNYIYYYVDRKTRASLLMMKQQFNVQLRKEDL